MHNPKFYQENNSPQKRDSFACLEKYAPKLKWKKNNNKVIDIGCGDGGFTNSLEKYLPTDFKLLGCDISEEMIKFATEHYSNERTTFTILDLSGDLPKELKGNFDHVFSFYTIQWIVDQRRAFENIFNLLEQGGEFVAIFVAFISIYDVYRILSRSSKWNTWVYDVEKYITPYQNSEDPATEVKQLMEDIGYVNIEVECKHLNLLFDDDNSLGNFVKAVSPFKIPEHKIDEFTKDLVQEIKNTPEVNTNETTNEITLQYKSLIVYGLKNAVFESQIKG